MCESKDNAFVRSTPPQRGFVIFPSNIHEIQFCHCRWQNQLDANVVTFCNHWLQKSLEQKTLTPKGEKKIISSDPHENLLPSPAKVSILVLYIVQMEVIMRVVSFSTARNNLKTVLDAVVQDVEATVITRRDAEDAVVMSLDSYNSLMETVHLLRSPANAAHLDKSIAQYQDGKTQRRDLLDA
jgi:antitoxin YefM